MQTRDLAKPLAAVALVILVSTTDGRAGSVQRAAPAVANSGAESSRDVAVTSAARSTRPRFPASYYTGPLGERNILPSKRGAFLIVQHGGYGVTRAQGRAGLLQRERDIGRTFDGIQVHYGGTGRYKGIPDCIAPDRVAERPLAWIRKHHSFPLVAWSPNRTIAEVNAGAVDRCLASAATHFKSYRFPLMLRLYSEFDVAGITYHACGRPFIKAWRRIVRIFQARGASNVGFWWVPTEGAGRTCVNQSYPGDAYVDWVGSDWFNTCDVGDTNCHSTPLHSGWAEFWEFFDYSGGTSQHSLWGPRKPFVVGETSSVYDPNNPSRKGDWFRNIPAAAKSMKYLCGISFYDADVSAVEGLRANYMVDYPLDNPDVYAGFRQMAADPWFNTR